MRKRYYLIFEFYDKVDYFFKIFNLKVISLDFYGDYIVIDRYISV